VSGQASSLLCVAELRSSQRDEVRAEYDFSQGVRGKYLERCKKGSVVVILWDEEVRMSKSTRNTGKSWSPSDVSQLKGLAGGNTPTRVIGLKLGRTPAAVASQASRRGISLKPTNQSPYGTKRK
jgi:hypothetical protein